MREGRAAKMAAPHTAATSTAAALVIGNIDNWQHFHILTAVASAKVVGNIPQARPRLLIIRPKKCYTTHHFEG